MEHNNLTSIAQARPIIFAEGLFVSCYLDHGRFVPEEGLNREDLWSILNGDFVKRGSDLVEDFTLRGKLKKLARHEQHEINADDGCEAYELQNFIARSSPLTTSGGDVRVSMQDERVRFMGLDDDVACAKHEVELRMTFESQVRWLMGEGEDFVAMERFSSYTDALILLDVLRRYNVPSLISFLAKRDEPIAVTFSKIQIDLDCLMFCLFQA